MPCMAIPKMIKDKLVGRIINATRIVMRGTNNKCPVCGKLGYYDNASPIPGQKHDNLFCSKECGKKAGLSDEELEDND